MPVSTVQLGFGYPGTSGIGISIFPSSLRKFEQVISSLLLVSSHKLKNSDVNNYLLSYRCLLLETICLPALRIRYNVQQGNKRSAGCCCVANFNGVLSYACYRSSMLSRHAAQIRWSAGVCRRPFPSPTKLTT